MRRDGKVKCFECRGTGSSDPDCWVCRGNRSIKVRRALALGWKKGDLENLESDGYCDCPRYECRGDSCDLCDGDGRVDRSRFQIEVTRCLVYGLKQRLPPIVRKVVLPNGRTFLRENDYPYLSAAAARYCNEREWGWRLNSMLGHEFHLRPDGEREATRRYALWLDDLSGTSLEHWLAWMSQDEPERRWWGEPELLPHEIASRWADDGGRHA